MLLSSLAYLIATFKEKNKKKKQIKLCDVKNVNEPASYSYRIDIDMLYVR